MTISPNVSLNDKGKDTIRKQLENLKARGFTSEDYFDQWFITDDGIAFIENYSKKKGR